jgi:hypothetical protein
MSDRLNEMHTSALLAEEVAEENSLREVKLLLNNTKM